MAPLPAEGGRPGEDGHAKEETEDLMSLRMRILNVSSRRAPLLFNCHV